MRSTANMLVALTGAVVLAAPLHAQKTIDRSRQAPADGVVEIENIAGSIRVEAWDRNEISLHAELGRGLDEVEFEGSGDHTRIRVVYPRNGHNIGGAELTLRVPAGNRVKVQGVSADVTVTGVRGPIDAQSVSGDVDVTGDARSVSAQSVSGEVTVRGKVADVRAHSVSGDVDVQTGTGMLEVETTSGEITLSGQNLTSLTAHSVSGEVTFRGSFQSSASVSVESFSGDVDFAIPANTRGDFELSTFSGDIRNSFNGQTPSRQRHGPGQSLEFSTGASGAQIRLKSFSGELVLRKM